MGDYKFQTATRLFRPERSTFGFLTIFPFNDDNAFSSGPKGMLDVTFGPHLGEFSKCEFAENADGIGEMYHCPAFKTGSVLTIKTRRTSKRKRLVLCEVFMYAAGGSPKY